MSMSDTIADMLTRIRNSCLKKHTAVNYFYSNANLNITKILFAEGFISGYKITDDNKFITSDLKYYSDYKDPVIRKIKRISKPGLRVYKGYKDLSPVMSGQGIYIVSTSSGVVSDNYCRTNKTGGEVLCMVY